ncbi:MAG: hypothetical protein Q8N59_01960, partial [bacterium]|nr:hypothetical protein [bacterium]
KMSILGKVLSKVRAKSVSDEKFTVIIDGKEYDRCVICREPTDVLTSTPIDQRLYHVEGAGQLDKKCFDGLYLAASIPSMTMI